MAQPRTAPRTPMKMLAVEVEKSLFNDVKVATAQDEITMADLIRTLLGQYLYARSRGVKVIQRITQTQNILEMDPVDDVQSAVPSVD